MMMMRRRRRRGKRRRRKSRRRKRKRRRRKRRRRRSTKGEVIHISKTQNQAFNNLKLNKNISTTVHATTKSFVPFCSVQNGESNDINCLVF